MKKNMKKFCRFENLVYLCTAIRRRSTKRGAFRKRIGRLAQLVQSVCLTSRGSGVRIPQRPPKNKDGSLAQLNRAFDYGSKGCGFESRRSHQVWQKSVDWVGR